MIKRFIIILSILLLIPIAFAQTETEYPNTGGIGTDFLQGPGGFDTTVLSTTKTRPLTAGAHVPLVADLDGDGVNEIIVVDDGSISLFTNASLTVVDSITLISATTSPPIVVDIDGDGFKEILIANEKFSNGNVTILEFNGTSFKIQNEIDISNIGFPTAATGTVEVLIQCSDDRGGTESVSCLYVAVNSPAGAGTREVLVTGFNATDTTGSFTSFIPTTNSDVDYCTPQVPVMSFADFDGDGRGEFIFSMGIFEFGAGDELKIFYFDVAEDLTVTAESISPISFTLGFNPTGESGTDCESGVFGRFISSPVVANLDNAPANGLETLVAINLDADDFVLKVFRSNGAVRDTHPGVFNADGELLGNPMLANVFGDTGSNDYCAFAQDTDEGLLKIVCGSLLTGKILNTKEFGFILTDEFNLSTTYNFPNTIAHMAEMQEDSIDIGQGFTKTTELIVAHGVFQITDNDFDGPGFPDPFDGNEMIRIFELPAESACIVVDAEKTGSSDIICVKSTAIQYIDDNIVNGVAAIASHREDPCIDAGPVGINTTFQVKLTAVDQNDFPLAQDLVSTRVRLYADSTNEQVSLIPNQTSGDQIIHSFNFPGQGINKTGSVKLVYEAFDEANPNTVDSITQTFTVAETGVVFGDCESGDDIGVVIVGEGDEGDVCINDNDCTGSLICGVLDTCEPRLDPTIDLDATNNAITNGVLTIGGLLGLAGTTVWLVIMIVLTFGIFMVAVGENGISIPGAFGIVAIANVLMIIVGARLDLLSTSLVVIITVLGVVIIGVFLGRFLLGQQANG